MTTSMVEIFGDVRGVFILVLLTGIAALFRENRRYRLFLMKLVQKSTKQSSKQTKQS